MSKWEKEDRSIYENSEVMMEFEKLILSRAVQLAEIYKKVAQSKDEIDSLTQSVKGLTEATKDFSSASEKAFSADDQESDSETKKNVKEDESLEDLTISAEEEIVLELRKLADEALDQKNMKLLYKIERTISEILND